jgi:hypothetical protein
MFIGSQDSAREMQRGENTKKNLTNTSPKQARTFNNNSVKYVRGSIAEWKGEIVESVSNIAELGM